MQVSCNLKLFGGNTIVNTRVKKEILLYKEQDLKETEVFWGFFFPACVHTPTHIKVFLKLLLVGQLSGCERSSQKRSWLWSVIGKILWNKHPLEQQHKPHHMLSTTNMFTCTQLAVLRGFMQTEKQSIQKPRLTNLWSQRLRLKNHGAFLKCWSMAQRKHVLVS